MTSFSHLVITLYTIEGIDILLEFIRKQEGIEKKEFYSGKYYKIIRSSIPLFNRFGYKKVSVDKIAKNAKIAKGTFYLYFKNKDELLHKNYRKYIFVWVGKCFLFK